MLVCQIDIWFQNNNRFLGTREDKFFKIFFFFSTSNPLAAPFPGAAGFLIIHELRKPFL